MYVCKTCGHITNEPIAEEWGGETVYCCSHCGDRTYFASEDK
jgi:DNA-directed RNA polymerase subunit RPC12/RpoP